MSDTITLREPTTGATAKVLPTRGFNCYSFQPIVQGESFEVLWTAPNFVTGGSKPSHSGIPILFPFPGRLRGSSFEFQGRRFSLEAGDGIGNAIHGFVIDRPWRVIDQTETRVVGEFQASVDAPEVLTRWPCDFRIAVVYELIGHALTSDIKIDNPGASPLPFGFGTHPYFRVPLGAKSNADKCVVTVPAAQYWELLDMLPTGRTLEATGSRGLAAGLPFAQTKLDEVFTDLRFVAGRASATIDDPTLRRRLELSFDDQFRECVVYNPPHREAICLEPYTCVPDTYALVAQGANTGLRVLEPGEVFSSRIDIRMGG